MTISHATVATPNASSFLRQLCRHWAHKFPVEFTDEHGRIELPTTVVTLDAAPETLQVKLELPDPAQQERLEQVVAEHLQRFGFRETLVFDWSRS